MRILLVNYMETTAPGGINKVVREIAKNLAGKGHQITVLQQNPMDLISEEIYDGFQIIRVNSTVSKYFYGLNPEITLLLKKCLRLIKPDIIHVHGYHTLCSPMIIYTLKLMKIRIPIIFTAHYDNLNHSTFAGKYFGNIYDRFIGKKTLSMFNYFISVSNYEANQLIQTFNVSPRKIKIVPHGVDLINIKEMRKGDFINLLYIGYLTELKGVQYILKALCELIHTRKMTNVKLKIIGEGPYQTRLLKLSKKLNINDFIIWQSFISPEKVLSEMRSADIFLLLSKSEGYGIVVAEALAMGTPVIVTRGTALEEFINEPGCFGVEYPPDPIKVAQLILEIYDNDVKVGPFSMKIRKWDKVAQEYENLYQKISANN